MFIPGAVARFCEHVLVLLCSVALLFWLNGFAPHLEVIDGRVRRGEAETPGL